MFDYSLSLERLHYYLVDSLIVKFYYNFSESEGSALIIIFLEIIILPKIILKMEAVHVDV